jgi:TolA-binding protein
MNRTVEIICSVALLVVASAAIVGLLVRWLQRTPEDPARLVFKWVLTAVVLVLLFWKVAPFVGHGGEAGAFIGVPLAAACAVALAVLWAPNLIAWLIEQFTSTFDGGDEPPEPRPAYSVAQARRRQGKPLEAVIEVRNQVAKFPDDFEGTMLLAQIQAEDLNDLEGAELTLGRFCEQPGHPPHQVAAALHRLADWHLKLTQDTEAARRAFERIIALYPETDLAMQAANRIAHVAEGKHLVGVHSPEDVSLAAGVENLGLLRSHEHLRPVETDPEKLAADYIRHLNQHPQDTEAREKLAVLYAQHYQRLDLATDQLEQLVETHGQSPKHVARWLNFLADLQVRGGADYAAVRHTLQTIIDRFPQLAVAELARSRIDRLPLEFKANEKNQAVAFGAYEQNLGLRRKPDR